MSTNPTHPSHMAPWWAAAMLAATASLPGCAGSEPQGPERPTAEATIGAAEVASGQGNRDEALRLYEESISLNPRLVSAYLGAGDIYRERGDFASAERRYAQAAKLEPRNFDAQYNQGLTLQLLGRYSDATRAYLKAVPLRPNDFNASLNLATTYLQLGEAGQAALYARHAVSIDPTSAPAHVNLAEISRALGRHDQAVAEYQQAATIAPLTPDALLNLADSLGEIDRYPEMADAANRVIEAKPSARAYERLGTALFRRGREDDALAAFQKSLGLDPDYCPALNGVGVCQLNKYLASGKTDMAAREAALAALRRSLRIERNQPRVKELLARWS